MSTGFVNWNISSNAFNWAVNCTAINKMTKLCELDDGSFFVKLSPSDFFTSQESKIFAAIFLTALALSVTLDLTWNSKVKNVENRPIKEAKKITAQPKHSKNKQKLTKCYKKATKNNRKVSY